MKRIALGFIKGLVIVPTVAIAKKAWEILYPARKIIGRKLRGMAVWMRRPDKWAYLVEEIAQSIDPEHGTAHISIRGHRHDR